MELSKIYGRRDDLYERVLRLRNMARSVSKKMDKLSEADDCDVLIGILGEVEKLNKEAAYLSEIVVENRDIVARQRTVLMKKLDEDGVVKKAITYFTLINNKRKPLYVKYDTNSGEEHHLVVDRVFDKYLEKRLTTPALVINCSTFAELESLALKRNIIVSRG